MEHRPNCKFRNNFFHLLRIKFHLLILVNTFISKNVLQFYFVSHIGRMDDIWPHITFYQWVSKSFTVKLCISKRNKHDLTKYVKEFIGYENNLNLIKDLKKY